jgi:hypothetical protein
MGINESGKKRYILRQKWMYGIILSDVSGMRKNVS